MAAGARDAIEASIRIGRPLGEVFDFYGDFRNIPSVVGDVVSSDPVGSDSWRWVVQGPLGTRVRWTVTITRRKQNAELFFETTALLGLRATWKIFFAAGDGPGETEVREVLSLPLGKLGRSALAVIGKYPGQEVPANLQRLKQVLESEPGAAYPH